MGVDLGRDRSAHGVRAGASPGAVGRPGTLGRVTTAIGEDGGDIGDIDLVGQFGRKVVREVIVTCRNEAHAHELTAKAAAVEGVRVLEVGDRTFLAHQGGKLAVVSKLPLKSPDDLSVAYTPGVGRVSQAIAADPERVWDLTIKGNSVAVVTDGTAVLGLGSIGPAAALPVMEGKAALFKEFADIDAFPICVDTAGPRMIAVVKAIAPGFGGINLEDIAAPACFEVEERLGGSWTSRCSTTTSTAPRWWSWPPCGTPPGGGQAAGRSQVVVPGAGAAGVACAGCCCRPACATWSRSTAASSTRAGGRARPQRPLADGALQPARPAGDLGVALAGADVFVGVSGPGAAAGPGRHHGPPGDRVRPGQPRARDRPRRGPAERGRGRHRAQRLPQPDQQRAGVPRLLPGPARRRARTVTDDMKVAAAHGLASLVDDRELDADFVIPSVFDRRVAPAVSQAVQETVQRTGLSRLVESG